MELNVRLCVANKYGEHITLGIRHHCPLMNKNIKALVGDKEERRILIEAGNESLKTYEDTQGFVDQFGNFLTRKEALYIVIGNKQSVDWERNGSCDELYSEGLY